MKKEIIESLASTKAGQPPLKRKCSMVPTVGWMILKLCVASRDAYVKMGMIHAGKDKKIGEKEIAEMEKQINGHSVAWAKMHNTGEHHGHKDRVIDSKVSKSKNLSTMYLVVKDHKKEPGKSRPIVTGCSGNTRALSNSVSTLLESVANTIENVFESISSEDMLHSVKQSNAITTEIKYKWRVERLKKLRCTKCDFKQKPLIHCQFCKEQLAENEAEACSDDSASQTGDTGYSTETNHAGGLLTTKLEQEMEMHYDCEQCGQGWRQEMQIDCTECGPGIYWEDQEICLLGLDVVALFPSMSSVTTGLIVRKHVMMSPMKIEGYDWQQGARYIVLNRKYTGNLRNLWSILPWRRKVKGTAPGIKAKELNSKTGNIEVQWRFPKKQPTPEMIREIQARCAEIATRFLF